MSMINLIFIVAATNAGKSTFLDKSQRGDGKKRIGLVEVGKILRAKYPPEHFKGQANPAHTEKEALEIMWREIDRHATDGKGIILVDGQPRDRRQFESIRSDLDGDERFRAGFIHLHVSEVERERRAYLRDKSDLEKLKLSFARLRGDIPNLYEVVSLIHMCQLPFLTINATEPFDPLDVIDNLNMEPNR